MLTSRSGTSIPTRTIVLIRYGEYVRISGAIDTE